MDGGSNYPSASASHNSVYSGMVLALLGGDSSGHHLTALRPELAAVRLGAVSCRGQRVGDDAVQGIVLGWPGLLYFVAVRQRKRLVLMLDAAPVVKLGAGLTWWEEGVAALDWLSRSSRWAILGR